MFICPLFLHLTISVSFFLLLFFLNLLLSLILDLCISLCLCSCIRHFFSSCSFRSHFVELTDLRLKSETTYWMSRSEARPRRSFYCSEKQSSSVRIHDISGKKKESKRIKCSLRCGSGSRMSAHWSDWTSRIIEFDNNFTIVVIIKDQLRSVSTRYVVYRRTLIIELRLHYLSSWS